ncbi:MAG: HIT family protein [Azoarcus sp.]|nr:HIT family protein [Azoarcus sp.]
MDCPFCTASQDEIVWRDESCRVVLVADPDYPGYCRVVWNRHVAEMSDLDANARRHLMNVALATERALRASMNPDKINLASLGNKVPHLHWHVVARFSDDRHFPESIWGRTQRPGQPRAAPGREALAAGIAREFALISVDPSPFSQ